MAINRFSKGPIAADVQSKFIPMPLDLIDRQIQRRQSAYDKAKATLSASEEALYGVKGMSADTEQLKTLTEEYTTSIDEAIASAGDDYSKLTAFSDQLATRITRDMKNGHLGAIHNNFVKAQNHMETLTKQFQDGKISKAGYERGLSSISGFGGTVEDGKGGYTKASFYTPTKYLELGKAADEYAAKIKDQYDTEGARYINVNTATKQILNNMWNNPQAVENAHEQIWSVYGDIPRESSQYTKLFNAYMTRISKNAADKIAFKQVFKDDGLDSTTNSILGTLDIIGARPGQVRMGMMGEDFDEILQKAKDKGSETFFQKLEKWGPLIGSAGVGVAGAPTQGDYVEAVKQSKEIEERNLIKNNEHLKEAIKQLGESDLARDMANLMGVDLNPETITLPQLREVIKKYNLINNSGINTRVSYSRGKLQEANFKQLLDNGTFVYKNVINTRTGEPLTYDQKLALFNNHLSKTEDKKGIGVLYGGETIEGTGQAYGPGTNFFSGNLIDDDNDIDDQDQVLYAIESDQVSTDPRSNWMQDRLRAAAELGIVSYNFGKNKIVLRKDLKGQPGIKMYINGKVASQKDLYGKGSDKPIKFPITQ